MAKKKISTEPKNILGIETKSNIKQAIMLLQTVREHINAHAAERAVKQLHVRALSQLNKELDEIRKKLSGYVNG